MDGVIQKLKIHVFSWNIGKNFTTEKMKEMIQKIDEQINEDEDLKDHVFVFCFQEVTYNTGLFKKPKHGKLDKQLGTESSTIDERQHKTYLVTGIKTYIDNAIENTKLNVLRHLGDGEVCSPNKLSYSTYQKGKFGIVTLAYCHFDMRKNLAFNKLSNRSECGGVKLTGIRSNIATKGILTMALNYKDDPADHLFIANCHLPLNEESDEAISTLRDHLKYMLGPATHFNNIIIAGDLNSRSLIQKNYVVTDILKVKKISCHDDSTQPYCKILKLMDGLPADKFLIDHFETDKIVTNNDIILKGKSTKNDTRLSYQLYENNKKSLINRENAQSLINYLVATDILLTYIHDAKLNVSEHPITFLPTYKRCCRNDGCQKEEGQYVLVEEKRLPGYTDRILYRGNIISNKYYPLYITGNDHYPIYGEYDLLTINQDNLKNAEEILKSIRQTIKKASVSDNETEDTSANLSDVEQYIKGEIVKVCKAIKICNDILELKPKENHNSVLGLTYDVNINDNATYTNNVNVTNLSGLVSRLQTIFNQINHNLLGNQYNDVRDSIQNWHLNRQNVTNLVFFGTIENINNFIQHVETRKPELEKELQKLEQHRQIIQHANIGKSKQLLQLFRLLQQEEAKLTELGKPPTKTNTPFYRIGIPIKRTLTGISPNNVNVGGGSRRIRRRGTRQSRKGKKATRRRQKRPCKRTQRRY